MKFSKICLFVLALGFGAHANAGLLLEPYLGYGVGAGDATVSGGSTGSATSTVSGMVYGARVGYTLPLVFIAADYTGMSGTAKTDATAAGVTTSSSPSVSETALGLDLGVSIPFLARLWAGYNFSVSQSGGTTSPKGSGIRAGIGLSFIPVISVNVEYMSTTYKDDVSSGNTTSSKDHLVFASVSVPFDL